MNKEQQNQIDALTVKFSITKEALDNLKEVIATGSLADTYRWARQLAHNASSLEKHIANLIKKENN